MLADFSISSLVGPAYLAAAALCVVSALRVHRTAGTPGRLIKFWLIFGIVLTLLQINTQYRYLTQLTQQFRIAAMSQGWYNDRWLPQIVVTLVLSVLVGIVAILLYQKMQGMQMRYRLMAVDLGLLLMLIISKTISFHIIDKILYWEFAGIRVHVLLQLSALFFIGGSALATIFEKRSALPVILDSGVQS